MKLTNRESLTIRSAVLLVCSLCLCALLGAEAQDLKSVLYTAWGDLCSVEASGTDVRCQSSRVDFRSPSWRPDGTRIVAESGRHDAGHSLVLLDRRGRRIGALQDSLGYIRPVWSPDGRFIFAIKYDLGSSVTRWDAAGTNKTNVRVTGGSESERAFQMISFSPSGARVALLTMHFREMVIASVEGTRLAALTTAPRDFSYVSESAWRDEDHLLFVGKRTERLGELWQLTISDGAVTKLGIDGLSLRDQLALSPDRESVVVTAVATAEKSWNVWKYSLTTGQKVRLTTGTEDIVTGWR